MSLAITCVLDDSNSVQLYCNLHIWSKGHVYFNGKLLNLPVSDWCRNPPFLVIFVLVLSNKICGIWCKDRATTGLWTTPETYFAILWPNCYYSSRWEKLRHQLSHSGCKWCTHCSTSGHYVCTLLQEAAALQLRSSATGPCCTPSLQWWQGVGRKEKDWGHYWVNTAKNR